MQELEFLTPEQIDQNYKRFRQLINEYFPSRRDKLNQMYDELEEVLIIAPASSYEHFHNAFPGGYVDHVLRVVEFTKKTYELWKSSGMLINFSEEEMLFAAFHHDLGKVAGSNLKEHYSWNTEEWWRKNRGKMYNRNSENQWADVTDQGFMLLFRFNIPVSTNEYLGIKLTDGMFTDSNKPYYSGFDLDSKLQTDLPYILHHADIMAYRFEFERWCKKTGKLKFPEIETPKNELLDKFDKIFDL